jgi:glycosyltransferase involved in cell wall biosynthesis
MQLHFAEQSDLLWLARVGVTDAYVALHRGEGYGINAIKSMALGIPVIATNYSATVDFFSAVSSQWNICHFPIPYKLVTITTGEPGPY